MCFLFHFIFNSSSKSPLISALLIDYNYLIISELCITFSWFAPSSIIFLLLPLACCFSTLIPIFTYAHKSSLCSHLVDHFHFAMWSTTERTDPFPFPPPSPEEETKSALPIWDSRRFFIGCVFRVAQFTKFHHFAPFRQPTALCRIFPNAFLPLWWTSVCTICKAGHV